jgi:hypothetical protein
MAKELKESCGGRASRKSGAVNGKPEAYRYVLRHSRGRAICPDSTKQFSRSIKQMMYRVGGPVAEVGCNNLSLRGAQLTF